MGSAMGGVTMTRYGKHAVAPEAELELCCKKNIGQLRLSVSAACASAKKSEIGAIEDTNGGKSILPLL